jgi:RNA polymerase sigma-70 factor (ECF subfamily)
MTKNDLEFAQRIRLQIPSLERYVSSRVDKQYVDDVCSDVIAISWQKREKIPALTPELETDPLLPYLIVTARNLVRNLERKLRTQAKALPDLMQMQSSATLSTEPKDAPLIEALNRLKPKDKELILLLAWQELSISEIASITKTTKANVSVRLNRARARLSLILQELEQEEHE